MQAVIFFDVFSKFYSLPKQFFSTLNVRDRNYIAVKHELQYIVYNLFTFKFNMSINCVFNIKLYNAIH